MCEENIPRLPYTAGKWHLPFPTGQYPVIGYQDIILGKGRSDGVFLRLLYPAEDQSLNLSENSGLWPNWFPHPNYKSGLTGTLPGVVRHFVRLIQYFTGDLHMPILPGVKLLQRNKKFPVMIFTHGLCSNRTTYSNICSQFASHGLLVAVLEHRDESAYATFYPSEDQDESYEWLPYRKMSAYGPFEGEAHFDERQKQMRLRVAEIRTACDFFQNLNEGNPIDNNFQDPDNHAELDYGQFTNTIDMENMIVAGHSYGGATVIFSLEQESRLKMGICLDSWMWSLRDFKAEDIQHPILFINMDNFHTDVGLIKMREFIPAEDKDSEERKVLTIKDSRHTDVSDIPMLLLTYPGWITSTMNWFLPLVSSVSPFAIHQATVSLCLDFINKHGTTSVVDSNGVPSGVKLVEGIKLKNE